MTPADVDVAEVHDCFTIAEWVAIEDLGFAGRGEGAAVTSAGETAVGGRIPVNPSGGLLSKGDPVGATGVAQMVEIVRQLRGTADNQVEGVELGSPTTSAGPGVSRASRSWRGRRHRHDLHGHPRGGRGVRPVPYAVVLVEGDGRRVAARADGDLSWLEIGAAVEVEPDERFGGPLPVRRALIPEGLPASVERVDRAEEAPC